MIPTIVRNGFLALRRDRGAFVLTFVLPVAFFSIFALVFGGTDTSGTPRVSVIVVDQDHTQVSARLERGLEEESSLKVMTRPAPQASNPHPAPFTAASAEGAVRDGDAPAAIIIPAGFAEHPVAFGPGNRPGFVILDDSSDPVAAQVASGMLQKVVMTSLPDILAVAGTKYMDQVSGGLSADQRKLIDDNLTRLRNYVQRRNRGGSGAAADGMNGIVAVKIRDVVGASKRNPRIAFYAAGVGVMFLLFTASAAAGSLIEEHESGALDRILSARVSMTTLLAGKMLYCWLLAFFQLVLMFLWGWAFFQLELFSHLPGFLVMTAATAFAVASFGMVLASLSRSRPQQAAISTLLILVMSAVGGSMFPRFLMPETMQKIGLFTFNAWAIDGYTKVFWRDEPITSLVPQVSVLVGSGIVLFVVARLLARRWEAG